MSAKSIIVLVVVGVVSALIGLGVTLMAYATYKMQQPPSKTEMLTKADEQPHVLVVTLPSGDVKFQDFGALSRCSEAATYIKVGITTRGVIAECVKR